MLFIDTLATMGNIEITVWAIAIGFVIGSFAMFYQKKIIGAFVRALIAGQIDSPEKALTVKELGFDNNYFVKNALCGHNALRRLVWEIGDNMQKNDDGIIYSARTEKLDVKTAKFYIPNENKIRAELRYSDKGTDIFVIIIAIMVFAALAFGIVLLTPIVERFLGAMFT